MARRLSVPLLFALIGLGVVALIGLRQAEGGERRTVSVELPPVRPGGPLGVAELGVDGEDVTARIAAWGFAPGTRHQVTLGDGACPPGAPPRRPTELGELVADAHGVAFGRLRAPARDGAGTALDPERVITVYGGPRGTPRNSRVACAPVGDGRRIAPADVAGAGPGEATRADVSSFVQVVGGRTIGPAPVVRARRGDSVGLGLRADLPDVLALEGYGLSHQVGPGTIARFTFRADRAGSFALRGRLDGGPVLLHLRVSR